MYTELNIGVALRADTPKNIIDILKCMLSDIDSPSKLPDHPLFETNGWKVMLVCDSCYFDGHTDSSLIEDSITNKCSLNVRCNLKNYDNEIRKFMNFIQPYLDTRGFLGYTRYEEYDDPVLIYNTGKEIIYEAHGNSDCTTFW